MRALAILLPLVLASCSPTLQMPGNPEGDHTYTPTQPEPEPEQFLPDGWGEPVLEVDSFPWYGSSAGPTNWLWMSDPVEVPSASSSLVMVSGVWGGPLSVSVLHDAPPDDGCWSVRFVHAGTEAVGVYVSGSIPDATLAMFEPGDVWPQQQGFTSHVTLGCSPSTVRLAAVQAGEPYGTEPIAEGEFPIWEGVAVTYILTDTDPPTWVDTDDGLDASEEQAAVRVAWEVQGAPESAEVVMSLGAPWVGVGGSGGTLQGSVHGPWYVASGSVRIGVR